MKIFRIIPGEYRDSLFLMKMSNDVSSWPGVTQAVIVMGTESNRKILEQVGLVSTETVAAAPNDLIIAIELDDRYRSDEISARVDAFLTQPEQTEKTTTELADLTTAFRLHPDINLVAISTPGEIAAVQARQALQAGKNVFCFSHHIPVETEIELKDLAIQKQLFMLGPDCGTAIIDGVGLGFANRVRKGSIGIVSASGSGLQEVVSLIHRSGGGVSQAVGVGGRDLTSPIDGRMAEQALLKVAALAQTKVIILLAKKGSPDAEKRMLAALEKIDLPIVTQLQGLNLAAEQNGGGHPVLVADTYEECAKFAVLLSGGQWTIPDDHDRAAKWMEGLLPSLDPHRRHLRGLYAGGSLCAEASRILSDSGFKVDSNLNGLIESTEKGHVLLDLGAEEYTEGRAHPFIDHRLRSLEIEKAFADPTVALLLVDVVLGYGCHPDPAGELAAALARARSKHGYGPAVIASVCGTLEDVQNYALQRSKLEDLGVFVAESNAAAASLTRDLLIKRLATLPNRETDGAHIEEPLIAGQLKISNVGLSVFIEGAQESGAAVFPVRSSQKPEISGEIKSLLDGLL